MDVNTPAAGGNGDFSQIMSQTADLETPSTQAPTGQEQQAQVQAPQQQQQVTEEVQQQQQEVQGQAPVQQEPQQNDQGLFEMPDGRKLTGEQLYNEYANNLLPEFTRRSQRLADLERNPPNAAQQQPQTPEYLDPNWVPQTYADIVAAAERSIEYKQQIREQQQAQAREQVKTSVDTELAEIKAKDPNISEDRLFGHALKYGFPSLKSAYQNMVDMNLTQRSAETRVQQNLANRSAIPIAGKPGSGTAPGEGTDLGAIRSMSAQEALERARSRH